MNTGSPGTVPAGSNGPRSTQTNRPSTNGEGTPISSNTLDAIIEWSESPSGQAHIAHSFRGLRAVDSTWARTHLHTGFATYFALIDAPSSTRQRRPEPPPTVDRADPAEVGAWLVENRAELARQWSEIRQFCSLPPEAMQAVTTLETWEPWVMVEKAIASRGFEDTGLDPWQVLGLGTDASPTSVVPSLSTTLANRCEPYSRPFDARARVRKRIRHRLGDMARGERRTAGRSGTSLDQDLSDRVTERYGIDLTEVQADGGDASPLGAHRSDWERISTDPIDLPVAEDSLARLGQWARDTLLAPGCTPFRARVIGYLLAEAASAHGHLGLEHTPYDRASTPALRVTDRMWFFDDPTASDATFYKRRSVATSTNPKDNPVIRTYLKDLSTVPRPTGAQR